MSEYLLEAYHSSHNHGAGTPHVPEIAAAAEAVTREGQDVHLVRAVLVPGDETCLYLFEAASDAAVVEAARRCGLRFERVVHAESA